MRRCDRCRFYSNCKVVSGVLQKKPSQPGSLDELEELWAKLAETCNLFSDGSKIIIELDEKQFTEHVKRICRSNIRKPCKICLVCPFRERVLETMKKNGWKLPE